jgi:uncharacterized membrane protein YbhN (UPF0104 family)
MRVAVPRQPRPIHAVIGVAGALLAAVIVFSVIGRFAGFSHVRRAVEGADFRWLSVCVAGQVAVFAGYAGALRHAVAAQHGPHIGVGLSLRVVFASFAATQLVAFGGAAGLALVYWVLRRTGLTRRDAAIRLIGLNTAVYLVFGAIGFTAAAWTNIGGSAPAGMFVPWLIGLPVIIVAARWFTAKSRVDRWTAPRQHHAARALATGVGAAAWVRGMVAARAGLPLFAWASCYWIGDIVSLWGALHAFGTPPQTGTLVLVYVTGYLVQSLPIPLIATGGVDAATTFLLNVAGVPLDVALVAVLAHRVFAFWLPAVPGTVFALLLRHSARELSGSPAA